MASDRMTNLPLLLFLLSGVLCWTFSTMMHTFFSKNPSASKCFLCLDFTGIAVLICGCCCSAVYYVLYCSSFFSNLYIALNIILIVLTLAITNLPAFKGSETLKVQVYVCQAGVSIFPAVQWLYLS